jgi:DNA-binding transcriptional LysR family regulator
VPAGDPLADKETITAGDLEGKPLDTLYTDHPTYRHTKEALEAADASFNGRFETQYFIPLFTFVERGLACSIVDPLSAESYKLYREDDRRIVFRPFRPVIYLVASIMTPAQRPLSNLAKAFAAQLRSEIEPLAKAVTA